MTHPEWKYQRIARELRRRIIDGDFNDGETLSERKLAREYGVHRSVISSALYYLRSEGLVSNGLGGSPFAVHRPEVPSDPAEVAFAVIARLDAILRDTAMIERVDRILRHLSAR